MDIQVLLGIGFKEDLRQWERRKEFPDLRRIIDRDSEGEIAPRMKAQEILYQLFVPAEIMEDPGGLGRILLQDVEKVRTTSDVMDDHRESKVIGKFPVPVEKLSLKLQGFRGR